MELLGRARRHKPRWPKRDFERWCPPCSSLGSFIVPGLGKSGWSSKQPFSFLIAALTDVRPEHDDTEQAA
jgi:hypothetical protein